MWKWNVSILGDTFLSPLTEDVTKLLYNVLHVLLLIENNNLYHKVWSNSDLSHKLWNWNIKYNEVSIFPNCLIHLCTKCRLLTIFKTTGFIKLSICFFYISFLNFLPILLNYLGVSKRVPAPDVAHKPSPDTHPATYRVVPIPESGIPHPTLQVPDPNMYFLLFVYFDI